MGTQVEDGELPEEGEIMEEEDEELDVPSVAANMTGSSDKTIVPSKKHFEHIQDSGNRSSSSYTKLSSAKFKDYDAKCALVDQSQEAMISSWVSGIQRKNRLPGSDSPNHNDRNNCNAKTGNDLLIIKSKSVADRDYRRFSTADGEILDDDDVGGENAALVLQNFKVDDVALGKANGELEFYEEDTDFRQHINSGLGDNFGNRRRRRSGSCEINLTKRQRGEFNGEIEMGDENSPSSSSPPLSQHHFVNNGVQFSTGYRGGFRGRGYMLNSGNRMSMQRWGERTICKFFREGFCRDGDECAFSHNAADSHRRSELCKFYQHGFCKKGLGCLHLHGEYPCKAFHKGECSKEQCQYSHQPLNDFTQPIFDQIMKDEELASRISLPAHPLRRKVLIPQGPESSSDSDHLPPPSVVVPVLSSMPPAQVEEKVMAATGSYGFFNPITPSSTSTTLPPPSASSSASLSILAGVRPKAAIPPPGLLPIIPPPISTPTSAGIGSFLAVSQSNKTLPLISSTSNSTQLKIPTLGLFSTSAMSSPTTSTMCSLITTAPSALFTSSIFPSLTTQVSSAVTFPGISSFASTTTSDLYSKQKEADSKFGGGFFDNFLPPKASVKNENSDSDSGCGFNINLMLERITQQVTGPNTTDLLEDSPASPPHTFSNSINISATKLIPVIRAWKLIPVEVQFALDTIVDLKLIGQISSGSYRNDPRLRKLAEKQFDLVTKTLEEQSAATIAIKSESAESNTSVASIKIFSADAKLTDPRKLVDPRKKAAPAITALTNGKQFVNNSEFGKLNSDSQLSSDELFQSMIQQQLQMVNQMNAAVAASTSNINSDDVDHRTISTPGLLSGSHSTSGKDCKQLAPVLSSGFINQQTSSLRGFGVDVDINNGASDCQGMDSFNDESFRMLNIQRLTTGTSGGSGNFKSTYFNSNNNGNTGRHNYYNNSAHSNANRYGNLYDDSTVRWEQQNNSMSPNGTSALGNFNQRSGSSTNNSNRNYLKLRYDQNYLNEVAGNEKASSSSPPNVDLGLLNKPNNLQSPSFAETLTITAAQQQLPSAPLSLREKRKNNEYESPLARATNKY